MTTEISPSVSVAKGASYLFIEGLVRNIAALVFFVYAARILSVDEVGIVSALSIVVSFLLTIASLAIPSAATKFISENMGAGRQDIAKGINGKIARFGLLMSLLVVVACAGASGFISSFLLGNLSYRFLIAILGIDAFFKLFSSLLIGNLWGLQKFRESAVSGMANALLGYGTSLVLIAFGFGLFGVVVGWIAGDLLGWILVLVFVSDSFKGIPKDETFRFRRLVNYSTPLYVSSVVSYFSTTVDKFVLLFAVGLSDLGIYNMALSSTIILGLVAGSISNALFPQFSKMYGGSGNESLKAASKKASRYLFLIYTPMSIGLASVSLPTITLFLGSRYASGWLPLTIVAVSMALTGASVIVGSLLLSLGATRVFLESNIIAVIVGTGLSVVLSTPFGISGVALARASLTLVSFLYLSLRLKTLFSLDLDIDALKKTFLASVVMAVGVSLLEFAWMNALLLPVYILLGFFIYTAVLKLLRVLSKEDLTLLKHLLPRRLSRVIDVLTILLT